MITKKAIQLSEQAKKTDSPFEALRLSKEFFEELFRNCAPTREEFITHASGLVLGAAALWDLAAYIATR